MKQDLTTKMNILKITLAVIGIGSCLLLFGGPNNTSELAEIESFRDGWRLSFATLFTVFVIAACVALVLVFFITQIISNPKKTIMSIIGLVVAFVLYLLLFAIGSTDTSESLGLTKSIGEVSSSTISATTAGLLVTLAGIALAVIAILAGPFLGKLRK